MKILTLSIKQANFDEILSGEKTQEFREVTPTMAPKYIYFENNEGKIYKKEADVPDNEGEFFVKTIKYDAIKFITGERKGKRPFALVEVKDAELQYFEDEEGELITYEADGVEYVAGQMIYDLGRIIEHPQ